MAAIVNRGEQIVVTGFFKTKGVSTGLLEVVARPELARVGMVGKSTNALINGQAVLRHPELYREMIKD